MGRMLEMPEIGGQFDPAETAIAERSDHVGPDEIVTIRAMVHRLGDQQEAPRAVYAIRQPNSVPNQHG